MVPRRIGSLRWVGNQLRGGFGMEVFRQIEFDDEERHREGEDAVGQGIEPALRNKLFGLGHRLPRSSGRLLARNP